MSELPTIDSVLYVNGTYHILEGNRGVCQAVSKAASKQQFNRPHLVLDELPDISKLCGSCALLYNPLNPIFLPDDVRIAMSTIRSYLRDDSNTRPDDARLAMEFILNLTFDGSENYSKMAHKALVMGQQYIDAMSGQGRYAPHFLKPHEIQGFKSKQSAQLNLFAV